MTRTRAQVFQRLGIIHGVFAAVFLLRLVALLRFAGSPVFLPAGGDMRFYDEWAQRILHGQLTDGVAFFGLPLYPYLLALVYKLFGYTPFIPAVLQAAADAVTAMLIYRISSAVFGPKVEATTAPASVLDARRGQIIGVLAATSWGWFVPAEAYALVIMPTALAVAVFWLVVCGIIQRRAVPGARSAILAGLLVGLAATGVATILFAVPLLIAGIALAPDPSPAQPNRRRWRPRLGAVLLLLIGVAAGTSPCWIHNYFVARDPVFLSSHGGINFWIGNNPAAKGYPNFPAGLRPEQAAMLQDSTSLAEAEAGHPLRRSEVSKFWSNKAKSYIAEQPRAWLQLLWKKALNFWNAFEYDDVGVIIGLRQMGVIWPGLHFGVAAALAIPGLILALRAFPDSRWIVAAVAAQLISVLPVFVTERYRLPAVPGLLIFASFGLWRLAQSCLTLRITTIAIYFASVAAGAAFVSLPRTDPSLWALKAYTAGRQALETGDLTRAERELQRAHAYVRDNPETNFALGNLRLAQGRTAEAKSFYEFVLGVSPRHKGALNNLGLLALEANQPGIALAYFQRAVALQPPDAKTLYLLARAQLASGDPAAARISIEGALKAEPDRAEYRQLREEIIHRSHE